MKEFFLKMLDSNDPTISSGIFLSILTVQVVLYTWSIVSIYLREVQDIPIGVYTFVGIVVAGKVAGTFAGKPSANTTTTVETASKIVTGDTK